MLESLFHWWNLLFVLPGSAAAILMLIQAVTGLHGETDVDHDIGVHLEHDFDHEVAFDHEADVDHDTDHDTEHDTDHDADQSGFFKALLFLGLGRIPVSMLISTFAMLWGVAGWISNQLLEPLLRLPPLFAPISCAVAFVVSVFGTRWTAKLVAKFMPSSETYVLTKADLLDCEAAVRYTVTERSGSAMIDFGGSRQEVSCRVREGEPSIPPGTRVILYARDDARDLFFVAQSGIPDSNNEIRGSEQSREYSPRTQSMERTK